MFALQSDSIITPSGIVDGYIVVDNGKIVDVISTRVAQSIPILDFRGKTIMPGVVDPHVHINEPGRTEWEGFDTATKAALAGGVTSLMEMPLNSSPVTTHSDSYLLKRDTATNRIHCNCGFWGGLVPENEPAVNAMIAAGIRGFKAFLIDSGIDSFRPVDETYLNRLMPVLAEHGLPLLVHCELETPTATKQHDSRSYQQYLQSRPRKWEDDAIALMIRLCKKFRCRVHIVHLSSSDSVEQIRQAKDAGLPLTAETAQHYLYFSAENIPDGRPEFKCAPPIREAENNDRLFAALEAGIIDFVATDHSPAPPSLKLLAVGDVQHAWGGISSLQFALSALLTVMNKRNVSLSNISKWLCERPALLPSLNKKGRLEKGMDADIIVVDPKASFKVNEGMVHHRHKVTPYLGEKLRGRVENVFLAGELVYEGGIFLHLNKGKLL